ncbi:MAG: hypothetical protein K1X47_13050 [Cyclobacteriaceae bacterium]|nr:hypothetical protein [Cyclobacteriaceae bacterium]
MLKLRILQALSMIASVLVFPFMLVAVLGFSVSLWTDKMGQTLKRSSSGGSLKRPLHKESSLIAGPLLKWRQSVNRKGFPDFF